MRLEIGNRVGADHGGTANWRDIVIHRLRSA